MVNILLGREVQSMNAYKTAEIAEKIGIHPIET